MATLTRGTSYFGLATTLCVVLVFGWALPGRVMAQEPFGPTAGMRSDAIVPGSSFGPGTARSGTSGKVRLGATKATIVPGGSTRSFEVEASHGYSVTVYDVGRAVLLEARNSSSRVEYTAVARGRGNRIKARFGSLGFVDMRFLPGERPRHAIEPGCHGRGGLVQRGQVVGDFRWRGEGGYSSAKAHTARGLYVRRTRETCRTVPGPEQQVIFAHAEAPSGQVTDVEAMIIGAHLSIAATVEEREAGMIVDRHLLSRYRSGTARSEPNGAVFLSAGPPFRGSAQFDPEVGSNGSWLGSLSGDFPGLGGVPLAGPEFSARDES